MGLDVNGYDNQPEWGYCRAEGCKEEAFPIWKSGDYPDDPDLLLCPKHIGALIGELSRQIGEYTHTIGYQDAMLKQAEADAAALRTALSRFVSFVETGRYLSDDDRAVITSALTTEHPGAALLARLKHAEVGLAAEQTLRARSEMIVRAARNVVAGPDSAGYTQLAAEIDAYDAAVKASGQ